MFVIARPTFRAMAVLGAFLVLSGSLSAPARAQPPDSAALLKLDDRLAGARKVRITTLLGTIEAEGVRVSMEGVAYRGVLASTRPDTLPVPGTIAWDAVTRLDVRGGNAARGAIGTGLVLAGIVAIAIVATSTQESSEGLGMALGIGSFGVLLGAGVGAGVGAVSQSWHRVYAAGNKATRK